MSRKKRKSFFRRNLLAIVAVLLLVGAGIYYVNDIEKQEIIELAQTTPSEPYHILENPDSAKYIQSILIEKNTSILNLSKTFYKEESFWPYILMDNPEIKNILDLEKGQIVKIPKLPASFISLSSPEQQKILKKLSDSLQTSYAEKKKEELEYNPFKDW